MLRVFRPPAGTALAGRVYGSRRGLVLRSRLFHDSTDNGSRSDINDTVSPSFIHRLNGLESEMKSAMSLQEETFAKYKEQIDLKNDTYETSIKAQLALSDSKMDRGFDNVHAKINMVESKLESKINQVESKLDWGLRELQTSIKATAAEIMKQQQQNEVRLVWRLFFALISVAITAVGATATVFLRDEFKKTDDEKKRSK